MILLERSRRLFAVSLVDLSLNNLDRPRFYL